MARICINAASIPISAAAVIADGIVSDDRRTKVERDSFAAARRLIMVNNAVGQSYIAAKRAQSAAIFGYVVEQFYIVDDRSGIGNVYPAADIMRWVAAQSGRIAVGDV